jgi:hypothetical protein
MNVDSKKNHSSSHWRYSLGQQPRSSAWLVVEGFYCASECNLLFLGTTKEKLREHSNPEERG